MHKPYQLVNRSDDKTEARQKRVATVELCIGELLCVGVYTYSHQCRRVLNKSRRS